MSPRVSVVVATWNRPAGLEALLGDLSRQSLPHGELEVIVVDDGSEPPVASAIASGEHPFAMHVVRQRNAGPAAARHRGIEMAAGEIIAILDDDMRVGPDFLEQHLRAHEAGHEVVLGYIATPTDKARMPIFERFHAHQLERFADDASAGRLEVRGVHLCTGNVSFRRQDYRAVGGFNPSLGHSEDRELGIRFEKHGLRLGFAPAARSDHASERTDLEAFLRRAHLYGVYDSRISKMHPELEIANPWRFLFKVNPVTRPFAVAAVVAPPLGERLARLAMYAATALDERGFERPAVAATVFAYGMQYFRGVRTEASSVKESVNGLLGYAAKRLTERAAQRPAKGLRGAVNRFVGSVLADYESVRHYRRKYHDEEIPRSRLPVDAVRKIGLQLLVGVRLMHLTSDLRIPLAPQAISRMLRLVYNADVHWDADIAPGVSVVHGLGLVISHAAKVGPGCIFFHNVTLGEGIDPKTREVGAPTLGRDVHVGPGACLLGPIHVGDGTKLLAGSVLTESVPPNSLVQPPTVQIEERGRRGKKAGGTRAKKSGRGSAKSSNLRRAAAPA